MSGAAGRDHTLLAGVLHRMATTRLAELYVARRYPEGRMRCPTHLCVGQEAVGAVFGALAERADAFLGTYRSHGHFLGKGGSLVPLFAELMGRAGGCSGGLGGSMHLTDVAAGFYGSSAIVGATVPIAAGVALGLKRARRPNVAVVFFGDAAMEEGVVYETVNFAVLDRLPVVFVCENNGLAISTPLEVRTAAPDLHRRFETMGLPGRRVDGVDVETLVDAASAAYAHARAGRGPAFVECMVSRWAAHVGHAVAGPVDAWWQDPDSGADRCPIARLVSVLVARGALTLAAVRRMREQVQAEVEEAFETAASLPAPLAASAGDALFASGPVSALPRGATVAAPVAGGYREPSKLANPF